MSKLRILMGALVALIPSASAFAADPDPAKIEHFEKKVRPILVNHCYACHSADTKPAGGLRVDDRNGFIVGGNTGPSVIPGKPTESLLVSRVVKEAKKRMPAQGEHLTDEQVATLSKWIFDGAVWPAIKVPSSVGKAKPQYEALKKEHWAWQPLTQPKIPVVRDAAWPRDDVDRYLLTLQRSCHSLLTP